MDLFHVNQSSNLFVPGCIAGAVCLVLWYFVTSKIMVYIRQKFKSDSKDKTEESDSSEASGKDEESSEKTVSDSKSESANPHLFDNLKVNDKE